METWSHDHSYNLGQLPLGQLSSGQLLWGNYPIGQLPHRTTTPQPITHHYHYPLGPLPLWDNYLKGNHPYC